MIDLMAESVEHHQETLDVNAPRDFTDAMLIEIQKTTDKNSSFYGDFGLENLKNVLFDLFLAGSETTSTTLTWAALYMVRYPQVQARVQTELDTVVGKNRRPAIVDKPKLPYTEVSSQYTVLYPQNCQCHNLRRLPFSRLYLWRFRDTLILSPMVFSMSPMSTSQ